jgi:signal transduction histidine kinase
MIPDFEGETYLHLLREHGTIIHHFWTCFTSPSGDTLFSLLVSPRQDIPLILRLLRINTYIKLAGTAIALILSVYFILFVLSPFRRMGAAARVLKKDISSVDEVIETFNETIKEVERMYKREKKKVLRLEKEMSLKEHLASIGEMSAGIAHEFKNSIGSIIGFTQLALNEKDNKTYLKKVQKEAEALTKVVNEFLFFSKPQHLDKESIQLKQLISELTENHPPAITVKNEINENLTLTADKNLLKRAFGNILKNAYESMDESGLITIRTPLTPDKNTITILFEDKGTGIPPQIQDEIFTPFFSTKPEGSGLGLSIVYKIITLHNGTINIDSSEEGTTIELTLPAL